MTSYSLSFSGFSYQEPQLPWSQMRVNKILQIHILKSLTLLFRDFVTSFPEPIYSYFAYKFKKLRYIIFYSIEVQNYKEVGEIGINKCIPNVKKWYNTKGGTVLLNLPTEFNIPLRSVWHCGSLLLETLSSVGFAGKPHSAGFLIKLHWQFFSSLLC